MAQCATEIDKGRCKSKKGKAELSCRLDGSPVTAIVMHAWLAVTGVPPVVHCRKTGLSAVALSAMEGKLVLDTGHYSRKWSQEQIHAWRVL